MASKRKREDDESEVTPCKTGRFASDEVKRSGRVRKKPARFVDDGEEGEREGETTDPSLTAEDIKVESPNSEEFTNVLQVHQKLSSPVKVCSDIGKLFQQTLPEENSNLTTVTLPQQVPVILTPTEVKMEPGFPPSAEIPDMTSVKSTRVRKKSAKVLEMEEFEEAERTKSSKKSGKLTSPDPLLQLSEEQQTANIPGGVQHVLQASNIQMNLMSALKASPIQAVVEQPLQLQSLASLSPQESATNIPGKKSSSKKKKADTAVSDADVKSKITLKIPKSKVKSADVNMLNIGNESFSSDKYIKEEIEESINPNLLLSHSSEPVGHLMDMAIKAEPVSPVKVTKRSKTKKANPLHEAGQVLPVSAGKTSQSSSVIKMLLNKPAQFSEPVVSTQSLTNIKALSSDSKTTKKSVKVKKESPMEESSGSKKKASIVVPVKLKMSPDSDASDLHIPMLDDTSFTEESSLSQIRSEKKKVKKMTKKQSTPVQDDDFEEDDDDEDIDDDDDDGDDIDMIDDTLEDSLGWEFETQDGSLIIAEDTGKKAKKTNVKKKAKMKLSSKGSVHVDDTQTSYATKGKKFVIQREKKKKRLTAYTMWCNSVRAKVLNESPGMDFAQLSRRLGEIWQSVPSKDKTNWKRKAKREARRLMGKGLLITTGKKGSGGTSSSTYVAASTETSTTSSTSSTPPPIQHPPIRHHAPKPHTTHTAPTVVSPKMDDATMVGAPVKGLGIEPIDTAAHLKLVGDSLSIIGMRLQEHRGLIAVQGSLSVLLDSLLCAVGPLMCLTTQVPELNGLPAETHTKVLDNIAYIMPGL